MASLVYRDIVSLADPLYDEWLDLYQAAFPLSEQVRISELNGILRKRDRSEAAGTVMAVLDEAGGLVGLALFHAAEADGVGSIWYLAVDVSRRSQGLGSQIYAEIRRRVRDQNLAVRLLVFEVEDPAVAHSPEERALAERRIAFYRRGGARLIGGIRYVQDLGWQPAIPMLLMAHPYEDLSPEAVFGLAKRVFQDAMEPTGPITLE